MAQTANTLSVTGLTDYVKQNKDQLFIKSALGAKTLDYVEIMTDVKGKEALHYLDSEVVFQKAACGWNPQGSDEFSERYIETVPIEIEKEFCIFDFEKKIYAWDIAYQAGRESLPVEEKLAESNVNAINDALENLLWAGDDTLGISGFVPSIREEGESVSFESGQTVSEKVNAMVAGLTADMLKKGVNIFMSMTDFRNYVLESNSTCCANRPILDAASESIIFAGDSRIKLVPVAGLEGMDVMVAATPDALVYATDIEDSQSVYRMFLDEKENKVLFHVLFRAGTAVKFPDEVVLGEVR